MRGETRRELVYRPESRPAPNPLVRVGSEDPKQQLGSSVASSVALSFLATRILLPFPDGPI